MSLPLVAARLFAQQATTTTTTAVVAEKAGNWMDQLKTLLMTYAVPVGGKIVGAIVLWIIGRIVIQAVRKMIMGVFEKRKLDATLVRYLDSVIGVVLTLILVISILSVFGIETTSFAGVLAAMGVAIGMAWSGLLSNFAAGVFMIVLRPFKVGDMITAGGVTGVVKEIGLFATTIDTADNIRVFVGNTKIFGDNIHNYTTNPYRRVDLKAQIAHSVNPADAINRLRARLAKIPNVVKEPAPSVELLEFTAFGPVLAVRPFCHNDHYWDVYFATNQAIVDEFTNAGYAVPAENRVVQNAGQA
ncbi:MAG: mechanosensitive ion channel family protein [Polyangiaceae bacterium]